MDILGDIPPDRIEEYRRAYAKTLAGQCAELGSAVMDLIDALHVVPLSVRFLMWLRDMQLRLGFALLRFLRREEEE